MSDGRRFWDGTHSWRAEDFTGTNYVTTRERGDIPGCVPAVDVFVEREISQVQWYNDKQIDAYAKAIRKEGPWPSTLEPFKNRAAPIKRSYYIS